MGRASPDIIGETGVVKMCVIGWAGSHVAWLECPDLTTFTAALTVQSDGVRCFSPSDHVSKGDLDVIIARQEGCETDKWFDAIVSFINDFCSVDCVILIEMGTDNPNWVPFCHALDVHGLNAVVLSLRSWFGGWTVGYPNRGILTVRAASHMADVLRMVGEVRFGLELVVPSGHVRPPADSGTYVLICGSEVVRVDVADDKSILAADLSTCALSGGGDFCRCTSLAFIHLGPGLCHLPKLDGCDRIGGICMSDMGSLAGIPPHAFHACSALRAVTLPKSLRRIGSSAFSWSGVNGVVADPSSDTGPVTVGDRAFLGCVELRNVSLFAADLGNRVFEGCRNLNVLNIGKLQGYGPETLFGSFVSEVRGEVVGTARDLWLQVKPPGIEVVTLTWTGEKGTQIPAMTALVVSGLPCVLSVAQRYRLSAVDLSALIDLPDRMDLSRCYFLVRAILPKGVGRIPQGMFEDCHRLTYVNTEECAELLSAGDRAFDGCRSLHQLVLPRKCEEFDFGGSGIGMLCWDGPKRLTAFFVGGSRLERMVVRGGGLEICLVGARGPLVVGSMTMGREGVSGETHLWPREFRFESYHCPESSVGDAGGWRADLADSSVYAEVAASLGRETRLALPV